MRLMIVGLASTLLFLSCDTDTSSTQTTSVEGTTVANDSAAQELANADNEAAVPKDPCDPPKVNRARTNSQACLDSPRCVENPALDEKTFGYVPERLKPLKKKRPKTIVRLVEPGLEPGDPTIRSRGKNDPKDGGVIYGLAPHGGGYGVYFAPKGEENLARAGYGDGWQSDIRDGYHHSDWNPTQAGVAWRLGTATEVKPSGGALLIKRFNMANFINDNGEKPDDKAALHRDFFEDDAINATAGREGIPRIVNGTDDERCTNETVETELRTEFDFQGEVEDYSGKIDSEIPVFRFRNHIEYARPPGVVMQFIRPKNLALKKAWLDRRALMNLSPALYPKSAASTTDLSLGTYTWGLRIREGSPYKYLGFKKLNSKTWDFEELKLAVDPDGSKDRSRAPLTAEVEELAYLKQQFVNGKVSGINHKNRRVKHYAVLSDGKNPNKAKAIGL